MKKHTLLLACAMRILLNLIALPIGEGGPRQRRSGALINRRLETLLPDLFHTACALSAPSGHLLLEGKADDTGIPSSKMRRSRHLSLEP